MTGSLGASESPKTCLVLSGSRTWESFRQNFFEWTFPLTVSCHVSHADPPTSLKPAKVRNSSPNAGAKGQRV